jgi:hypothetical protein
MNLHNAVTVSQERPWEASDTVEFLHGAVGSILSEASLGRKAVGRVVS